MLSKDLELALIKAIKEAKQHRHEYVTVEHMLYGLLHDEASIIDGVRLCKAKRYVASARA